MNPFNTKVDSKEQDLYYADAAVSDQEKDEFTEAAFDAPEGMEATARAAFESRWGYK